MVHGACEGAFMACDRGVSLCCALCRCCRANAQQPKLFVGMILILIFAEALALYGLIGANLCLFLSMGQMFGHGRYTVLL